MKTLDAAGRATALALLPFAGLGLFPATAFAADEICASCGAQVSVTGNFTHHKDGTATPIAGATSSAAGGLREDVNGAAFSIAIAHLPAGRYGVAIGAIETEAGA